MKIGFDGKRATQNFTGLGNYSRYILEILAKYYPHNEYIVYAPKKKDNKKLFELQARYPQIKMSYPKQFGWKKISSIWRIWGVTKQLLKEDIQMYHGLSNELPLNIAKSKTNKVVTIHDLIFLRYPQYYKRIDRKIYTYKFRKACLKAEKIIAVSECTKRDIIRFFSIPEDKIVTIYQGCDQSFYNQVSIEKKEAIAMKYNLPDKYILNVGSIEERKNVLLVVKALVLLQKDVHLVIIGRRTPYTRKVEAFIHEHGLHDRVHILTDVPLVELPAIYQQAEIFVYPSRFEGFGIPIIEALHSGVPVVGATGSCLEEAGGPDSLYVHPDDYKGLAEAFIQLFSNPELRNEKVVRGKEYVKRFSEEKQAGCLMELYLKIMKA